MINLEAPLSGQPCRHSTLPVMERNKSMCLKHRKKFTMYILYMGCIKTKLPAAEVTDDIFTLTEIDKNCKEAS